MKLPLRLALLVVAVLAVSGARAQIPRLDLEVRLDPGSRALHAVAQFETSDDPGFALHRSLEVRSATVAGKSVGLLRAGRRGESNLWRIHVIILAHNLLS